MLIEYLSYSVYLFGIAMAHFAAERYEQSLTWWKEGLLERPDLTWPLRSVAACLGLLGRLDEARDVVRRVLLAYPGLTVTKMVAIMPHRGDYPRRFAEGLLKAGLPE